jgi:hypothetical protein
LGYYFESWCAYLRGGEAVMGLPLCMVGAVMMLAGWRLWTFIAVAVLALAGGVAGQTASGDMQFQPMWSLAGAGLFAIVGLVLHKHTPTVVGGVLGGAVVALVLEKIGLEGAVLIVGALAAFIGAGAWSFAYKQQVVIVVSSLVGGALVASGMAIMMPQVPLLYGFFRSMTARTPLMAAFFVVVPTVMGITLQYADSNRSSSKAVRS